MLRCPSSAADICLAVQSFPPRLRIGCEDGRGLLAGGNSPKATPRLRSAALPSCYPPTADIEVFLLTAARPCGGVTHLTQVSGRFRSVCHSANSACDPRPVSETIPHMDQYKRTNGRSKRRHRR